MAGETGAGAPSTHSVLAGPPIGFFIFCRSSYGFLGPPTQPNWLQASSRLTMTIQTFHPPRRTASAHKQEQGRYLTLDAKEKGLCVSAPEPWLGTIYL
jgi:hypothetical protein